MLKKITLLLSILIIISKLSFGQKFINDYDGIPLIVSTPYDISAYPHYDSIKAMGANFVIATELTQDRLDYIKSKELKVIPAQSKYPQFDPNIPYNYIMRYSEGAYTKWEAEGTPIGKGEATLKLNSSIDTTFNISGRQGVVTKPGVGAGSLFDGPGYFQERRYWRIDTALGYIRYKADFNMMLSPGAGNPTDTICILQVTDSEIKCCYWDSLIFVKQRVLLRSDFTPGAWQTFQLEYDFRPENIDEQGQSLKHNFTYQLYQKIEPPNKNLADFVQFKVIWKGDPNTRLYVDNVIVYDDKGKAIVTNPATQQNIVDQATLSFASSDLDNYVTAWLTIDEPETIDNYEPIRVIDSLLKARSQGKEAYGYLYRHHGTESLEMTRLVLILYTNLRNSTAEQK